MSDRTLCSIFERAAGSENGLRFLNRKEKASFFSYADLLGKIKESAGAFVNMGLLPGDKTAIVLPTSPEFFYAFFGVLFAGGVPVPLYPPVRLGRMDEYHIKTAAMLSASDARLVITDNRIRKILGRSVAKAAPELGLVSMDEVKGGKYEEVSVTENVPGLIQFSSGTTMDPKPVLLTHKQILANADAIRYSILDNFPESKERIHAGVTWLPLYHDMGLIGCVVLAIAHPADLTLIPPEVFIARPAMWLRAISKYGGSISPAPNFAFSYCVEKIKDEELDGVDLSSWCCALNGAEPVTHHALESFIERFSKNKLPRYALTPVYGLAEAALAVTFSDMKTHFKVKRFNGEKLLNGIAQEDDKGKPLVSVGIPLPEFKVNIKDEKGKPCGENIIGNIFAFGPSIMEGYYNQPEKTRDALKERWLNTGDLGFIHEDELYIFGRAKDMIIIRGRNYSPQTIEQAVDEVKGARKGCSAAVGYAGDEKKGEVLWIFIERDKKTNPEKEKKIAQKAASKVTRTTQLVPDSVIILDPGALPRTSSGKIKRREALRQYLSGTLAPPKDVGIFMMTAEMIRAKRALVKMDSKKKG